MLPKKNTKSKIGSTGFNLSDFTQPKFQTKVQCLFCLQIKFSCSDNILQPETVKLNVTKSYILVDVVGVSALA